MSKHWRSVLGGAALVGLGMVGVASLSDLIAPSGALAGSPACAFDEYVPPPEAPRTEETCPGGGP
jgi:hypothetical protein